MEWDAPPPVPRLLLPRHRASISLDLPPPLSQVCNTFTQLAAALADATPDWLCPLLGEGVPAWRSNPRTRQRSACPAALHALWTPRVRLGVKGCAPAQSMRLVCASQLYSTDWGSSAWRMFPAAKRRVMDREVFGCAQPTCMPTPLHPELWPDLVGSKCPSSSGDTIGEVPTIYGQPLLRTKHHG